MSYVLNSTGDISVKQSSTGCLLPPLAKTPTSSQEFITGHHADNHIIFDL
jgi:hypothetical protein